MVYIGDRFGDWVVEERVDYRRVKLRCTLCGEGTSIQYDYHLSRGSIKKCDCVTGRIPGTTVEDLRGKKFGKWTPLNYKGNMIWECRCEGCGRVFDVRADRLRNGTSTQCKSCSASNRKPNNRGPKEDITGQQFGLWTVLEYVKGGLWKCQCGCDNHTIRNISSFDLKSGKTTSCGCAKQQKIKKTSIERFGVENFSMLNSKITPEQREILHNKEKLEKFIRSIGYKVTIERLSRELGVRNGSIRNQIYKFGLEDLIIVDKHSSQYEDELKELFPGYVENNRHILGNGQEIDLYYPDRKVGIEFNGNYWHSDEYKDSKYHQIKSALAIKNDIHLINIFEYEWNDLTKRSKIIDIINRSLRVSENVVVINSDSCDIIRLNSAESTEFQNKYHLKMSSSALIHLGLKKNDKLVGLMTFGRPRTNTGCEWELERICWKDGIIVEGGAKKLFNFFLKRYNPSSISVCDDLSKIDVNTYTSLGFTYKSVTAPDYVWFDHNKKKVIYRNKDFKNKLLDMGLGTEGKSEDDIMNRLGFIKIYDCGTIRFEWRHNE